MVIGISGKIGSGKDTVGKIVQYLVARAKVKYELDFTLIEYLSGKDIYNINYVKDYKESISEDSKWKIKKFAGKLKQIVSILTGIAVNDLEKQEVKDLVLPKEWQEYQITNWGKSVGLLHALRFITEEEVQEFCTNASNSQHDYRYIPSQRTVRWLLQTLGTQALRDVVHANVHINALFVDYKATQGKGLENHTWDAPELPNWIITDMRFTNELQAVKNKGGITIRVNRPMPKDSISLQAASEFTGKRIVEHPSETALDRASFDYIIENNGTIEELVEKVKQILTELKFI